MGQLFLWGQKAHHLRREGIRLMSVPLLLRQYVWSASPDPSVALGGHLGGYSGSQL